MVGKPGFEDRKEEEFLKEWNERFTASAGSEVDAHRSLGSTLSLESILSHVEQRQVTNDYTVAWGGEKWQIPETAVVPGLRRSSVRIDERLDGSLQARLGEQWVPLTRCETAGDARTALRTGPARRYVSPPGKSQWMRNFNLAGQAKQPAAQGPWIPLSRFPSGESRGGRVPPTPQPTRLPPQEGSAVE